jgi:broad specificity phosphatase PhoE
VRHGESAGNVARHEAEASGRLKVRIPQRDIDAPLSPLGQRQARVVGQWFGNLAREEQPTIILSSPYLRTRETTELLLDASGIDAKALIVLTDERLREREFGIFDRLTKQGVKEKYPEQHEMRNAIGKFYHRPPGGESWCDVILRLRSVVDTVALEYRRERVLIVTHEVVINCFRYLLEKMTEEEILAVDNASDIANCSITSYRFDQEAGRQGAMKLVQWNFTGPLESVGEEITTTTDKPIAPK